MVQAVDGWQVAVQWRRKGGGAQDLQQVERTKLLLQQGRPLARHGASQLC